MRTCAADKETKLDVISNVKDVIQQSVLPGTLLPLQLHCEPHRLPRDVENKC